MADQTSISDRRADLMLAVACDPELLTLTVPKLHERLTADGYGFGVDTLRTDLEYWQQRWLRSMAGVRRSKLLQALDHELAMSVHAVRAGERQPETVSAIAKAIAVLEGYNERPKSETQIVETAATDGNVVDLNRKRLDAVKFG